MRLSLLVCLLPAAIACAAEPALEPSRVCEVLQKPAAYAGQAVLVLGRFSFREDGRFLSERCPAHSDDKDDKSAEWPTVFRIVIDPKSGPKPPERLAVDSTALDHKMAIVKRSTTLAHFRFASTDYDRWALVYGRVEVSPEFPAGPPPAGGKKGEFEPAPVRVVCRGEALVIFLNEPVQ